MADREKTPNSHFTGGRWVFKLFLQQLVCYGVLGDKVWKYYGFRLLGGRTFDSTRNAANAMSALTDRTGTIYLLKVTHWRYQIFTARGSDVSIVFSVVANFFCQHDNSRTAALSSMPCCMNMYLDDLKSPIEYQGRTSKAFYCVSYVHDTA